MRTVTSRRLRRKPAPRGAAETGTGPVTGGRPGGTWEQLHSTARRRRGSRRLSDALLLGALVLAAAGVPPVGSGLVATTDGVVHLAGRPQADASSTAGVAPAGSGLVATDGVVQLLAGPPADDPKTVDVPPPPPAMEAARMPPQGVRIDAIGVSATTVPVGLAPDGSLDVPPPGSTGWYSLGIRPGDDGYAVIAGHVDSHSGPDVFYRLRELNPGDVVSVRDESGRDLRFVVESTEQHAKTALPASRMWQPAARPMLALITCGGAFDPTRRTYLDNVVVYAALDDPSPTVSSEASPVAAAPRSTPM